MPHTPPNVDRMHRPEWRLVLLLAAVCFFGHFNRNSIVVAGDLQIMEEYDIAPERMGLVYSAFLLFYTLLMVPGGWLIDCRGAKFSLAVVCLGSALFIVLTASVGLAATAIAALPLLIVIRSAMGALNAPLHPAAANAVSQGIPLNRRSAANGLVTGAALLGVASSFVVFGKLVDWFNWPAAFLVTAGVTALLAWAWLQFGMRGIAVPDKALSAAAVKPAAAPRGQPGEPLGWRAWLVRHKNLLLLTASYAAVGYFQYLFFYWIHYYFDKELQLGEEASRFYAGIPLLAMAAGMPLGGWLSDRLQALFGWRTARAGLAFTAMCASACLLWCGVRAVEPVWVVTLLALALGVLGLTEGLFWLTAVEVGGNRGGLSAGIFNTGGNLGGIVVPVATPLLSRTFGFGWENAISVASVVCLAGAFCWIWIDHGQPRHERVEPLAPAPQGLGAGPVNS